MTISRKAIWQQKVPAGETDETTGIQNAVKEQETASRTQQTFQLPDTVNGQKVTWRKKVDYRPLFLPVVGIVLIICIQQKPLQDKKKEQKLREKELLREYPTMVMQMSLLMGAGMTMRKYCCHSKKSTKKTCNYPRNLV